MDNELFSGTGVALVTPFNQHLEVDFNHLNRLIKHVVQGKVDYLVVLGTTGEASTLSTGEKESIIRFVVENTPENIPVIAGIGGNDTRSVLHTIKNTNLSGVAGILSVAPYYNKPNQRGLAEHFGAIASESPVPVIVYNIQSRTGINIQADTLLELSAKYPRIAGVKEASGNLDQINRIIMGRKPGFRVISGDDALTLPLMACGADGVISVTANAFPSSFSTMVNAALAGNFALARQIHQQLYSFTSTLFEDGSPAGIKVALEILGLGKAYLRLPLTPVNETTRSRIAQLTSQLREI